MQEFIARTVIGIEDIAIKEIEEFLGVKAKKILEGRILFKATLEDTKRLIYFSRSLVKCSLLISRFT